MQDLAERTVYNKDCTHRDLLRYPVLQKSSADSQRPRGEGKDRLEERHGEVKPDNKSSKWLCHGEQGQGLWGCPASSTMLRM